jgi:hypothetical protein
LDRSGNSRGRASAEARDLEKIIMIHALDLLYFWLYQPRSRTALRQFLHTLTEDERHILVSSQFTLLRHREISQLFIDGILGDNFPRPLSFYLSRYEDYLKDVKRLIFDEQLTEAGPYDLPGVPAEPAVSSAGVKDYCEAAARRTAN